MVRAMKSTIVSVTVKVTKTLHLIIVSGVETKDWSILIHKVWPASVSLVQ